MPGIDPNVICHRLTINPAVKPIAQKKRHLGTDKRAASLEETQKLLNAGFIKELRYSTWLANVVMVRKNNGKWRMCVDYTDLNKACPKDAYPLPCIDKLVDNSSGFQCYNQILMHKTDQDKTAFITDNGNFCYKVMPFGLKNAGATYQRLMDKIFTNQIGRNIEVFVDDMVAKSKDTSKHIEDLTEIFQQLRKYNMKLNPDKCAFGVQSGKFLGFMLTCRDLSITNHAISSVLVTEAARQQNPVYFVRRLIKWSIELSKHDIQYESRGAIKSQALADFIAELTTEEQDPKSNTWTLYVDGASNSKGSGAGILLEDEHGTQFEQSLQFTFHASNNQAEYEALIAGLRLAQTMGITHLDVKCDSLLVVQQNDRADILSKLATTRSQTTPPILSQLTLEEPSVILNISQEDDWRSPFITYLQTGNIPNNVHDQRRFKRRASFYTMLGTDLYKRGFTRPLLRCLNTADAKLAIDEVHEGVCGTHIGGRSFAAKILRAGYYWPTLQQDCTNKVKYCDHCQRHVPIIHSPAEQLHTSEICWPFNKWGLDILGPFPPAPGQGLKKKLDDSKGEWAELILEVLWSYNTTEQSTTKETPFRLVYGSDAMIPIEVSLQNTRTTNADESDNTQSRRTELDLLEETRDISALQQVAARRAIARKYNKRLKQRTFSEGDLVLRKVEDIRKPQGHGKVGANWEGPFRVQKVVGKGVYKLQRLDGAILPNTWNIASLKMYFS
ncbi:uncharacterized protein [Arachis hypogaea]|uniref:uncharacterized protein n=1 Tax=Arachis hypogaea TaxID=3818 RepID=UPI003B219C5F